MSIEFRSQKPAFGCSYGPGCIVKAKQLVREGACPEKVANYLNTKLPNLGKYDPSQKKYIDHGRLFGNFNNYLNFNLEKIAKGLAKDNPDKSIERKLNKLNFFTPQNEPL